MAEVKDRKGWPIAVGARVRVRERPGLAGGANVAGFSGKVTAVQPDAVEIQEFGSFHHRAARPTDVTVQRGKTVTKAAREHEAVLSGSRKFLAERQARVKKASKARESEDA